MSRATFVPETHGLDSEDAFATLRRVRYGPMLRRSIERLRDADGLPFARAVAFQVVLTAIPALIFLVAVTVWTGSPSMQSAVEESVQSFSPGASASVLSQAIRQAERNARGDVIAMVASGITALASGIGGMAHLQRGFNRLYGVEDDRSWWRRYANAGALTLGVGALFAVALVALAFGDSLAGMLGTRTSWLWVRWPLGLLGAMVAIAVLFRYAPHRRQPAVSWLITGGLMATVLWVAASVGLAFYLQLSSTFGQTYGQLAGFVGVLLWAQVTGVSLILGMALAAQLEAERAGAAGEGER